MALQPYQIGLKYLGHFTILITTPNGVTVTTVYNDYIPIQPAPTIVTINLAHDTHHSMPPNPKLKPFLKGWRPNQGTPQFHDLKVKDLRARNIPTNIRKFGSENDDTRYGNSIFVFEVSGLCIAHLGNLHHALTVQQLGSIGQMDVVLVPVDSSFTLHVPGMVELLKALKAPLVIPMHYFSEFTLGRPLEADGKVFNVKRLTSSELTVSRDILPAKTEV